MKSINFRSINQKYHLRLMRAMLFVIVSSLCTTISTDTSAQTKAIKILEDRRKAAQADIALTTSLLEETRSSAESTLNRLHLLTEQVASREKVITILNQEISLMDREVSAMNDELSRLKRNLTIIHRKYANSLRSMYKHRSKQNRWYFILSADGFAQMTRRTRYLREYADWRKRQANSILERQVEISKKQAEVAQARADKQQLLNQRGQEAAQLQKEESDRRREVEKLSAKRKELQTQLAQKQKQERALRQQIERLITKELEREQERQRLAEKVPATPKKPSGGGESKSPSPETPSASMSANAKDNANLTASFVANKGRLPFPLTGKYKVVMKFGDRTHPDLQYVRLRNSGIDIQTTAGSEAQSIFAGKVTARFMAPGYNWGIIVRHGSYLSVYVNLSEVYVNIDEKVTARQRLGKIATDISNNRATILHFELHKEKEALDPEAWIK